MKKILAVDDDAKFLRALKKRLESRGYQVRTSGSALEAQKAVEKEKPDVILLDVRMPGKGGLTFLQEFYADSKNRQVKTIILTNFDPDQIAAEKILKSRPFSCLLKIDTSLDDLQKEIERV